MKNILILIALFLSSQSVFSYDLVSVGIQGGMNAGLSRTNPDLEPTQRNSPMGGMFFETLFTEDHGILFDLLYSQKGGAYKTKLGVTNELRYDYFQIDALYKFTFFRHEKFRPSVFAGPGFGYLVQATSTTSVGGIKTDYNIKHTSMWYDVSGIGGIWLEYDANENITVVLSGRYEHGLSDTNKDNVGTWINQGTQLMAGIKFPL